MTMPLELTVRIMAAEAAAQRWIGEFQPSSDEEVGIKQLATSIAAKRTHRAPVAPCASRFEIGAVLAEREELLSTWRKVGMEETRLSTRLTELLGLSFLRSDDLQAVAACLRALGVCGHWSPAVASMWSYTLAHQNTDGSFGLVAPECRLLKGGMRLSRATLILTLETCQAIYAYISGDSG